MAFYATDIQANANTTKNVVRVALLRGAFNIFGIHAILVR